MKKEKYKKKFNKKDKNLELVLSDGKRRKFVDGNEMYEWARRQRPNWKFE